PGYKRSTQPTPASQLFSINCNWSTPSPPVLLNWRRGLGRGGKNKAHSAKYFPNRLCINSPSANSSCFTNPLYFPGCSNTISTTLHIAEAVVNCIADHL